MFFLSFLFLPLRTSNTHKDTNTNRQGTAVAVPHLISSSHARALLSLSSPQSAHAIRASESVLDFVCLCVSCVPPLQGAVGWPCWLPGLFVGSGAAGSGRWRGLRVRERRRAGRLGVRSDRRVTGCYLGLLSSTPAPKIAFATPVNLPLHFDWSQLCPLHVHQSMTHDEDEAVSLPSTLAWPAQWLSSTAFLNRGLRPMLHQSILPAGLLHHYDASAPAGHLPCVTEKKC